MTQKQAEQSAESTAVDGSKQVEAPPIIGAVSQAALDAVKADAKKVESAFIVIGPNKDQARAIMGCYLYSDTVSFPPRGRQTDPTIVGRHHLEVSDQSGEVKEWAVLGSTIIDERMKNIEPGQRIIIEYTGSSRTSGGDMKEIDVYVLPD